MKYKSENEIMGEWVKEIKDIPNVVSKERIIKRMNWLYLDKILDFRLKNMLKEKK